MTPTQVINALRKRWKLIVLILVIGIGLSVGLTLAQTRIYTANTQVFVSSNTDGVDTSGTNLQGNSFVTARVQNYTLVAKSRKVTDAVIAQIQAATKTVTSPPKPSVAASPTPSAGATPSAGSTPTASSTPTTSSSASTSTSASAGATPSPSVTPTLAATDTAAIASATAFKTAYPQLIGLNMTSPTLGSKITATVPNGKVVMNLSVSDHNPEVAAQLCNLTRDTLISIIKNQIESQAVLNSDGTPKLDASGKPILTSAVNIVPLETALVPQSVSSPNVYLNIGVGAIVGLLLGALLAVLREFLDNTFKSADQLTEITDLPVLGVIPWDRQAAVQSVAFRSEPRGQRAEAFRHLRTSLDFVGVGSERHIIAVTSAVPGEGKTSTAINIAAALAEGGQRVCLVEADLRKPTIAARLGLVREVGLTSVLIGKAELEDVLQNAGQNLAVLTSGEIPPNPSELLRTNEFADVLDYIASKVDRVVVDAAPLLPVADGAEVAAVVGDTLLCVRAGKTTREQVRRSVQTLANVGVKPVGALLSMASQRGAGGYDYYAYYGATPEPKEKVRSGRRRGKDGDAAAPAETDTTDAPLPGLHAAEPGEATDATVTDATATDATATDTETTEPADAGTRS